MREHLLCAVLLALVLAVVCQPAGAVAPGPQLPALMNADIVTAIDKGLSYLSKMQQPDGSFPAKWDGKGYPATMTSLAGLALLASGSTPEQGPYAQHLKKAMIYLLELGEAHPDGLIAGPLEMRATYGHGFAMLFLAQCYGDEQTAEYESRLKKLLDRAIALVARGQSPKGGWLYSPLGGGDEGSTTACVLQGLRACRNAGIKVPQTTIDRAVDYMRYCQNPDGGICYSSAHRGASRVSISAAAVSCFYSAGIYDRQSGGDSPESAMVEKLWRYLAQAVKNVEDYKGHYCYHHFYYSQAQYVRGGREWEAYYCEMSRDLVRSQAANGSWPGDDVGPVYGTAIACTILQLPYGYLPICER